jgi:mono/diheme cytochrome c family protein
MNLPVWDLPFAHGLLIAVVAGLHVFVSHFAVGGGLYLVVMEQLARKRDDQPMLATLQSHSKFFLLLTLVFGAISGVGIWFTAALINPAGLSALIRAFVWGWAIEWTFFVAEIAAAMVYVYGWKRLSPGKHVAVGWIYFINAWLSMVVINGILSFQLTPGAWLETRAFWDGFFNPTYVSSLFVRTFYAIGIAGLFALWTLTRSDSSQDQPSRLRMIRGAGIWSAVGVGLAAVCTLWWWSDVPESIRAVTGGDLPIATMVTQRTPQLAALLAVLVIVFPLALPRRTNRAVATLLLLVGLGLMTTGEWARESIRKPFIIYDYMYSNGVIIDEIEALREEGIAARSSWVDADESDPVVLGEQVFRAACQNCHARDGYNGLAGRVAHWDEEFISGMTQRTEYMRRVMPPWVGTPEEADALAAYLVTLKPEGVAPPADGEDVFDIRCASCHSLHDTNALLDLVEGMDADELDDYFSMFESDYMPAFTGTDEERRMLAEWLVERTTGEEVAR